MAWRDFERITLFLGVVSAFFALGTGEIATESMRSESRLVEFHSSFAVISTWFYGALLVGELAAMINARFSVLLGKYLPIRNLFVFLEKVLCDRVFSGIIAFAALVLICITGILGGAIVYGISADPFAGAVMKMLGIPF